MELGSNQTPCMPPDETRALIESWDICPIALCSLSAVYVVIDKFARIDGGMLPLLVVQ